MNIFKILTAAIIMAACSSTFAQLLPGTVKCMGGSTAHPVSYCVDSTPCKTINGATVCLAGTTNAPAGATFTTATCWATAHDYTCLQYTDSCATYTSDANCTEVGTKSCTLDESGNPMVATISGIGACQSYSRTFTCTDPTKPNDPITKTTSCDLSVTQNGLTWNTTTASSVNDFVQAATAQEFARELVTYATADAGGIDNLFPGHPQKCTEGYGGLKNCCKSSGGGGMTNSSWTQKLGASVAMGAFKQGAGYAASVGSSYMYDTIMNNAPEYMTQGVQSFLSDGMTNSWMSSGFGAFGIGTTAEAAGGMFGATSSMAIGQTGLYFNPYALAAAIAIQIVMDAIACDPSEKDLANARGQDLCHYIGSYCSSKTPFGCMETSQSFCCYNGLLPKGIEEAAHEQLGLSWGTPKSPICKGLTPAQLTALDFSSPAMQKFLEPFKNQIMSKFNANAGSALSSGSVQSDITTKTTASASALCLQRQKLDPTTVCP